MKKNIKKISKLMLFVFLTIVFSICLFFALKKVNLLSLKSDVSNNIYSGDKIHFLKNEETSTDAILIQSNGHCGLVDTMYPDSDPNSGIPYTHPSLNFTYDNGTKVKNYAIKNGCTYLDFVILTHNHTDHHAGLWDLQDLITDKTIVFYKEDKMPDNNPQHDVEEIKEYFNHDLYELDMTIFASKNVITCDVSASNKNPSGKCYLPNIKNDFITGISENPNPFDGYDTNMDYTYYFTFGNYTINLYNLYTLSLNAENYNSIITLLTHNNGIKTLLTADIETSRGDIDFNNYNSGTIEYGFISNPTGDCEQCISLGLENQIADIIGKVDVLKAAHHGLLSSNSYYVINKYQPSTYIINNTYDIDNGTIYPKVDATAAILLMKDKYGTSSYYTNQSDAAVVVQLNNDGYSINNYACNNSSCYSSNDLSDISSNYRKNRWYRLNDITNDPSNMKYIYVGNDLTKNKWKKIDNNYFYFDENGTLKEGLVYDGSNYYHYTAESDGYYPRSSVFTTGWKKIKNDWYYFRNLDDDGSVGKQYAAIIGWGELPDSSTNLNWYYFDGQGKMQEGLIYDGNNYYYLRTETDATELYPYGTMYADGWKKIDNRWYYFRTKTDDITEGYKGSALTGWAEIKNTGNDVKNWYYFDSEGVMQEGLIYDGSNYYYLRHYNEKTDNHPYGSMYNDGWLTIDNNTYYFRKSTNDISTGKKGSAIKDQCVTISNVDYCFGKNGALIEGDISKLNIKDNIYVINSINDTVKTITDLLGTTNNVVITRNNVELSENDILNTNDILSFGGTDYNIVILGDVKPDGIIDIRDVAKAYDGLANGNYTAYSLSEKYALDINGDNKKTILDLIRIYDSMNVE